MGDEAKEQRQWEAFKRLCAVNVEGYFKEAALDLRKQIVWTSVPWSIPKYEPSFRLQRLTGLSQMDLRAHAIASTQGLIDALRSDGHDWDVVFFGYGDTIVDSNIGAMTLHAYWVEERIGNVTGVAIRKKLFGGWETIGELTTENMPFPEDEFPT